MNILTKIVRHLATITKHKLVVFRLCLKVGEPWRGLVHDLSKYSPTEFWEGVRYYIGDHSPITDCKKEEGYSKAWLYHRGRNKHHADYWVDLSAPIQTPIMPYPYVAEMLCDKLAAGIVYQGENWTKEYQLMYWNREKHKMMIHENVEQLITDFLTQVSEKGIDSVLTKKNVKELYHKYCETEEVVSRV